MSIRKNVIANYIGQGYSILIGIAMVPLYLQYMGAEAYGLVGFFAMLQSWLSLVDLGMSPTLSREVARSRAGALGAAELRSLVRSFETFSVTIGVAVCVVVWLCSDLIARSWLKVETLDIAEVALCVGLIGIMIVMRSLAGFYKGGIIGMERQVWLNAANVAVATVRYVGVLGVLCWVGSAPRYFFGYQLCVAVLELACFALKFYSLLPCADASQVPFRRSFSHVLGFASSSAYVSVIYMLLTQVDKLILSRVLPLSEYGYFSVAVVAANGIQVIATPISTALLPRMTYLLSQEQSAEMRLLYRKSTQITVVITSALSGVLAAFAEPLLFAWTTDARMAASAAPILFWYALGNGILSISAFQYYLQYAHGNLRLHVIYNTVLAFVSIPVMVKFSVDYGAVGAGVIWFLLRLLSFLVWPAIVHRKLMPGFHLGWIGKDVIPIICGTAIVLYLIKSAEISFESLSRLGLFTAVLGVGLVVFTINILISSACRGMLVSALSRFRE